MEPVAYTPEPRCSQRKMPSWLQYPGQEGRQAVVNQSAIRPAPSVRVIPKEKKPGDAENLPAGNLMFADYRWWVGARLPHSIFSICRACRQPIYSRKGDGRRAHHSQYKCTLWITEAATITQKGRICVMCEEKTKGNSQRWGIALCSEDCMERWMFMTQPAPLWLRALALARPKVEKKLAAALAEYEKEQNRYRIVREAANASTETKLL